MKAPTQMFARLGWWLLMEIGFGGLIDKFESHFGSFVTKLVLGIAGLAFVAFCMQTAWDYAVGPLLSLFGIGGALKGPIESVWIGATLVIGVGAGSILFAAVMNRRIAQLEGKLREVSDQVDLVALAPIASPHI
jgi:hypothetical protein